jgi:peptidyl-prolyl cis-trans isomerase A (cyclophilin A)
VTNTSRSCIAVIAGLIALAACTSRDAAPRTDSALLRPDSAQATRPAPDSFRVAFETSRGQFVVQAHRAWAPNGVDRFHYLVRSGYYDGVKFFRVVPNFVVQFGIHGDPAVSQVWRERRIPDDSVRQSNLAGYLTFATGGPNTRTAQLFINKRDNARLDAMGFSPIGRVVDGMSVVDSIYGGYGEGAPRGDGPFQDSIQQQGNAYLNRAFPRLDSIVRARVLTN